MKKGRRESVFNRYASGVMTRSEALRRLRQFALRVAVISAALSFISIAYRIGFRFPDGTGPVLRNAVFVALVSLAGGCFFGSVVYGLLALKLTRSPAARDV